MLVCAWVAEGKKQQENTQKCNKQERSMCVSVFFLPSPFFGVQCGWHRNDALLFNDERISSVFLCRFKVALNIKNLSFFFVKFLSLCRDFVRFNETFSFVLTQKTSN